MLTYHIKGDSPQDKTALKFALEGNQPCPFGKAPNRDISQEISVDYWTTEAPALTYCIYEF